ncbi:hypothetical protein TNCT_429991 [Trichonephila clavata]|uniref:Uncharacterized protein n=1 Tax=Trichonephila clavata TaxID=2740835 RepID=A0A8X6F2V9_TRICU|nr:hypothetical protein TNCT_429991 [Trichonephila clavata]
MAAAIKLNKVPLIPRSAPFSSFLLVGVGIGNNREEGFLIPRQLVVNCESTSGRKLALLSVAMETRIQRGEESSFGRSAIFGAVSALKSTI